MGNRKIIECLDNIPRPFDLDACEVWHSCRQNPLAARLFKTIDRRWFLDASGSYLELEPARAAALLHGWGQPLPPDLAEALKSREAAESPPGPKLPLPLARAK